MKKLKPKVKPPVPTFNYPKPSFELNTEKLIEHLELLDRLRQKKEKLKKKLTSLLPWWEQT